MLSALPPPVDDGRSTENPIRLDAGLEVEREGDEGRAERFCLGEAIECTRDDHIGGVQARTTGFGDSSRGGGTVAGVVVATIFGSFFASPEYLTAGRDVRSEVVVQQQSAFEQYVRAADLPTLLQCLPDIRAPSNHPGLWHLDFPVWLVTIGGPLVTDGGDFDRPIHTP